ncbi:MAG: P-loop NTPase [Desulfohalobiaceae bacterium]|nr:P-loop NTPase [Desulfohalobiaceae bacterium]
MSQEGKACGSGCQGQQSSQCGANQQNQDQKLQRSLQRIRNKFVVLSGKGGVGKSSVATNLAVGLARQGKKVGLMDVDVHGPSIPRLLNLEGSRPVTTEEEGLIPIKWGENLGVISLGFFLPEKSDSVIWRGPVKMKLIQQFLEDVSWGDLDYLVIDCPPGTGDEPLSVMQLLGTDAQGIVVTTPQDLAVDDVRRSVNFCQQTGNPVLGLVENMSGLKCPHCGEIVDVFASGGGERLAHEAGVQFLGRIPLDPEVVRNADQGKVTMSEDGDTPATRAYQEIINNILHSAPSYREAQQEPRQAEVQENPDLGTTDGKLRIAVPVAGGRLCQHFGHCEQFALVDADPHNGQLEETVYLTPPPHEPGVLPKWLAEQGAHVVLAGGMGARAVNYFHDYGVRVVTGAEELPPQDLARNYLQGTLTTGENACTH